MSDSGPKRSKSEGPEENSDTLRSHIIAILRSSPGGIVTEDIIRKIPGASGDTQMEQSISQSLGILKNAGIVRSEGLNDRNPKWFLSEQSESSTAPLSPHDDPILGTTGPH